MINPNKSANKRRNRKYHLIFNNPEQHDGCSHQAIKEKLSGWENIVYWCMCDEIANAPHTHLYVQFKHPIYFNHMKEKDRRKKTGPIFEKRESGKTQKKKPLI